MVVAWCGTYNENERARLKLVCVGLPFLLPDQLRIAHNLRGHAQWSISRTGMLVRTRCSSSTCFSLPCLFFAPILSCPSHFPPVAAVTARFSLAPFSWLVPSPLCLFRLLFSSYEKGWSGGCFPRDEGAKTRTQPARGVCEREVEGRDTTADCA